jgi:hypothetical protein
MQRTIFYSWQSDLPNSTNRGLIQKALENAAKALVKDGTVDVQPVIERDTLGIPGAPDIAKAIFAKIDAADVFVADVSIINGKDGGKLTPNPNVLVELGYALGVLGDARIILVANTEYGEIKELPFDLRMRRTVPYSAIEGADDTATARNDLQGKLKGALTAALSGIGIKVKETVRIQNGDGSALPLLISGRQQSAHDASLTVLSGLVRVVNCIQQPVTIEPKRLIVEGKEWPVQQMFFQSRKKSPPPKEKTITVEGGRAEDYLFNLIFPMHDCPEKKSGTLSLQINEGDEFPLQVKFA